MDKKNLAIVGLIVIVLIILFSSKANILGGQPGQKVGSNSTSTSVTVAPSSVQLLAANGNRNGVVFSLPNMATSTVWVTCGSTAVVGQGISLATSTQLRYESNSGVVLVCAWNAISSSASTTVGVFEY